jgi:hypothetical protein
VNTYLVQLHMTGGASALAEAGGRARSAAEQLTHEGSEVRYARSIYGPEDDGCFLVFECASPELAGEASRRASLEYRRIVERASPLPIEGSPE